MGVIIDHNCGVTVDIDYRYLLYLYILFIECFTTTFLHTHSWLNWVDEDDVGLKLNCSMLKVLSTI